MYSSICDRQRPAANSWSGKQFQGHITCCHVILNINSLHQLCQGAPGSKPLWATFFSPKGIQIVGVPFRWSWPFLWLPPFGCRHGTTHMKETYFIYFYEVLPVRAIGKDMYRSHSKRMEHTSVCIRPNFCCMTLRRSSGIAGLSSNCSRCRTNLWSTSCFNPRAYSSYSLRKCCRTIKQAACSNVAAKILKTICAQ